MSDIINIDDCWNTIGVWRKTDKKCEKLSDVIHCYNCDVYSNAGRSLLNRESPEGYTNEWADILAEQKTEQSSGMQSAIVFRLGAEWLALPVMVVNEISLLKNIYAIPHNKNNAIKGMVNIRGELVICMSLGNLFGIEKPNEELIDEEHSINRLIMIREKKGHVVFPVSEIDGIIHYNPAKLSPAPDTIKSSTSNFIIGISNSNERNIGCIDHTALIEKIAGTLK